MIIKIYHQQQIIFITDEVPLNQKNIILNPSVYQIEDVFFNSSSTENLYLVGDNFIQLKNEVYSIFKIIEAAGGLVENPDSKFLLMFRRGSWDLPKGKIDDGETPEIAAVREVEEETGISNITLHQFITTTYHTYYYKNNWGLKPTHWYKMTIAENQELIPQTEEDIEELRWVGKDEIYTYFENMYSSIKEVLSSYR